MTDTQLESTSEDWQDYTRKLTTGINYFRKGKLVIPSAMVWTLDRVVLAGEGQERFGVKSDFNPN